MFRCLILHDRIQSRDRWRKDLLVMRMRTGIRDQLKELLTEGAAGAINRQRTSFDESAGAFRKSLVLFGAGNLGRKTLAGLRRLGIEPLAFADNNSSLWTEPLNGIPVMSPQKAAAR